MASNEAILEIAVETRDALKNISKFQKQSSKSLQATKKSFDLLKVAAAGAVAVFASAKLVGGIKSVTEAASIQEDAINSLNSAMKISGDFSEEASQGMQDYASAIQETTKFGDEAILQTLSLAKAYGATNEQAKLVASAATEFAAASGKSLQTATEQISKSLGGFAGELGEINPAIKALTKEQLAAGGAAKILIDQYGGSAAAQIATFSGAVQQSSNTFGDLQEELGFLITRNPIVIKLVAAMGKAFKAAISFVQNNSKAISQFISKGLQLLISTIPTVIKGFSFIAKVFGIVAKVSTVAASGILLFVETLLEFDTVKGIVNAFAKVFKGMAVVVLSSIGGILKGLELLGVDVGDFGSTIDEIGASLVENFDSDVAEGLRENVSKLRGGVESFGVAGVESLDSIEKGMDAVAKSTQKVSDEIGAIDLDKVIQPEVVAKVSAAVDDSFFGELKGKFQDFAKGVDLKSASTAVASSIFKGADGARELLKKGSAALGDSLFPGAGGAIGEIVGELSKGPEHVKTMVTGFVEAIPELIANVSAAAGEIIPALIISLADQADEIIIAIVKALPRFNSALIRAIPAVARALKDAIVRDIPRELAASLSEEIANAAPEKIAEAFAIAIVEFRDKVTEVFSELNLGLTEVATSIEEGAVHLKELFPELPRIIKEGLRQGFEAFKANITTTGAELKTSLLGSAAEFGAKIAASATNFGNKLLEFGKGLLAIPQQIGAEIAAAIKSALPSFSGGGGGAVGGAVSSVKKVFGLASGGTVPSGFNDDSFPASLTSGELVVPRDDVSKLRSFLNNQGGDQGGVSSALLAQIADLLAQPVQVSTTAEVDGEAMANIMLNLSRQNARTA